MKNTVLFCTGLSGSGKSWFIDKYLTDDKFYKLKSATTRPMRDGEQNGREYFFVDETYFDTEHLVTKLWVNEAVWAPNKPKWMYGVPESQVLSHMGLHLIYDVIQPKYVRQMIDWFIQNKLNQKYDFKTLYFLPPTNNFETARQRANMPDDMRVRQNNTCDPIDFLRANVQVDWFVKSSAEETIIPQTLIKYLHALGSNIR